MNPTSHVFLVSTLFWICGCSASVGLAVRKVDLSQTPEMSSLAERARQIGNDIYPKVLTLLPDKPSRLHHQFDIVFKPQIVGNAAQTIGTTIYLNAAWFRSNPDTLEVTLPHEMAHVAQQHTDNATWYWTEGLADYVCYKLGCTNGATGPQSMPTTPHYTSGYWCTGAFLLFIDASYGSEVVQRLNIQLRRGRYSDRMFVEATGKSLDELWKDFQKTPAYKPPNKDAR
jgi:Peptidase of plants and bacteria